jgi:hypothetical protein
MARQQPPHALKIGNGWKKEETAETVHGDATTPDLNTFSPGGLLQPHFWSCILPSPRLREEGSG